MRKAMMVVAMLGLSACAELGGADDQVSFAADPAPQTPRLATAAASFKNPVMRWDHKSEGAQWTQAALAAVYRDGGNLTTTVPDDIASFCPAYPRAGESQRAVFWVGLMSALAKHESTWNPRAVGGGDKWFGLLQIAPITWRHYGCEGNIRNGADNLACSVRIMDAQVGRDGAIVKTAGAGGWRGVARDWMPMRKPAKLADMRAWTRKQDYCRVN